DARLGGDQALDEREPRAAGELEVHDRVAEGGAPGGGEGAGEVVRDGDAEAAALEGAREHRAQELVVVDEEKRRPGLGRRRHYARPSARERLPETPTVSSGSDRRTHRPLEC